MTYTISYFFAFLQVTVVFTKNVYSYSFRIGLFNSIYFSREKSCLCCFYYPMFISVTRETTESTSEDFL